MAMKDNNVMTRRMIPTVRINVPKLREERKGSRVEDCCWVYMTMPTGLLDEY